ncbi:Rmr1 protein [Maudiozyma humilis]|uniref:Rmr1 protein n=1 Tax=Maudiozyma humilis TaxID=51915 RepID=A0AAV5RU58_MAUHU|nr:Rmr1 protein [Kazachstania humilis]
MSFNSNDIEVDGVQVTVREGGETPAAVDVDQSTENLVEEASDVMDTDDEDMEVDARDEEELRDAARSLLRKLPSRCVLQFQSDTFLLFDYEDSEETEEEDESLSSCPIICSDASAAHESLAQLLPQVRKYLTQYYNGLPLGAKELVVDLPALDLTLYEDNMYNNQVTFSDIDMIFKTLQKRSRVEGETGVPRYLVGKVSTRPRFVARYNSLVELTEGSATLKNTVPFSNDEDNPVVLDDEDD